MNLIGFFKKALNIGGPQIDLVTRDPEYYPSEWIRGELSVTAPDYRQNIQSITINLKDFWVENLIVGASRFSNRAHRYQRHCSIAIANDYVFLPGMKYQFPFEIQLPVNCRVSSAESGWRLGVVIAASGSPVLRKDFNIQVRLSKVLQQIIEAIEKDLKFAEVPRGRKYLPETSATRFVFRSPDSLQPELGFFMIDISFAEEGGIKGSTRFHASGGNERNLFTAESDEHCLYAFRIEPSRWLDSKGQVQFRSITNIVSDQLREVLDSKILTRNPPAPHGTTHNA